MLLKSLAAYAFVMPSLATFFKISLPPILAAALSLTFPHPTFSFTKADS